jgi:cytochrome c-type protein NapC/trimethylamine-N-oxide reductase cytochrome c-type subunit TorC
MENEQVDKTKKCKCWFFKNRLLSFITGLVVALLVVIGSHEIVEATSKSEFCGTLCHEMDTAYNSWKLSNHGTNEKGLRADCIDCHLPPKEKYFSHLAAKTHAGIKDSYKHFFVKDYDAETILGKVLEHFSNDQCLSCHLDLLAKPSDEMVEEAHKESLNPSEDMEIKCVECHGEAGHVR